MPTVNQGAELTLTLAADDAYQVSIADGGDAYVDLLSGAPGSPYASPRLRAPTTSKVFGPYGVPARIKIRVVAGAVTYATYKTPQEVEYNPATGGLEANGSPVSGDGTPTGASVTAVASAAAKVASEGTTLKTGSGLQLYQPDGTNAYMVATSSFQTAALACTVTWAAGSVANVQVPSGHACVEQDAFVLQVATPGSNSDAIWAQVLRVAAVVDEQNITVRLPFTPAAGPVSATTFRRCIRNVTIDLDLDYNYAGNNAAGNNANRMALVLAFLADSTVRVRGKNAYKYIVLAAGCDNVQFDVGAYPNHRSDTFKLYGPANNNTIRVYGQAAEDCVSLQALEPAAFIGYMPCQGNIRNTRLRGVSARVTTAGSGPVVVYADPTYTISGTVIEDGESVATAGTADGFAVRPGIGFVTAAANIPDLTLRNMEFASAGGDSVALRAPGGLLRIDNCKVRAPGSTSQRGVYFSDPWDVANFDGNAWLIENWTPVAGRAFIHIANNVKTLRFNSCRFRGKSGTTTLRMILLQGAAASCNYIEFNNCEVADMDNFLRADSDIVAAPTVVVNGGTYTNVLTPFNFRKVGGKLILNGPTISGATNGVCRSEGAGVITDVIVPGAATLATPSQLAVGVSGGKVNLKAPNMSFDPTAAVLNNAAGNEFVASVATGTLTIGMPVIGDGTVYRCRYDLTKTS